MMDREPNFIDLTRYALDRACERLHAALAQMSAEDLAWRPDPGSNSAANLARHICGNARQRIVARIGGAPDVRDREAEFAPPGAPDPDALTRLVRETFAEAQRVLAAMSPEELTKTQDYDGVEVTHRDMLLQCIGHYEEHVGQVIFIAKQRLGTRWQGVPWGWGPVRPEGPGGKR